MRFIKLYFNFVAQAINIIAISSMKHIATLLVALLLTATPLAARNIDVAAIDSFITHIESNNQGIGSVAVAYDGEIIYSRHFGKQAVPPHNNSYNIGSITKMFTATLIHRLCAEQRLSLDTTLDNYFPHISTASHITIRHLLNHTSGLADYTIKQDTLGLWLTQPVSTQEIFDEIVRQDVIFEAGSNTRYSNTAYYLLGNIIEQLYNAPWHEVIQREITQPLSLNDTHPCTGHNTTAAPPYRLNTANRWQQVDDFYFPNVRAVGDIISTPHDLITFINALYDGTLIDSTALALMQPAAGNLWGCGMILMPFYHHHFYGHTGGTYGISTVIMHNPTDSTTIALALNGCSAPYNDILIGIASAIYNTDIPYPDYAELQQYTATPQELAQYAGVYTSQLVDMPIYIIYNENDNNLSIQVKGQPAFWLEAKRPGVFVNSPTGVAISFKDSTRFIFKQFNQIINYVRQ